MNAGNLAAVSVSGLGLFLVAFGIVGAANYLGKRYGRFSRDASGRPTSPLVRGTLKNDRLFAIPLTVAGCVGVVLLIVSAVR